MAGRAKQPIRISPQEFARQIMRREAIVSWVSEVAYGTRVRALRAWHPADVMNDVIFLSFFHWRLVGGNWREDGCGWGQKERWWWRERRERERERVIITAADFSLFSSSLRITAVFIIIVHISGTIDYTALPTSRSNNFNFTHLILFADPTLFPIN